MRPLSSLLQLLLGVSLSTFPQNSNAANAPENEKASIEKVVIDLSDKKLYIISSDSEIKNSYSVAIGSSKYRTPTGNYNILAEVKDPTWYVPAWGRKKHGFIVPSGQDNPLGTYWMSLSNGYGIHGTNNPASIGKEVTHGCIRLNNKDIADLVRKAFIGMEVEIRD